MGISNRTDGSVLISVFGKNLTTKEIDIYQVLITTSDPMTIGIDGIGNGGYELLSIRGRDGNIISQAVLDEKEAVGDVELSILEDFDYLGDNVYGNSKNKVINIVRGESFKDNGDTIVPIGTNGTAKGKNLIATAREMNIPCSNLLYFEGSFIKNNGTADHSGSCTFRNNPLKTSFNQTHKTFCLEIKTTENTGTTCKTIPIVANTGIEWQEGDVNKLNIVAQRGCDVWERDDFWTEVHKEQNYIDKIVSYKLPAKICRSEESEYSKLYNINCDMVVKEFYVAYIVSGVGLEKTDGLDGDLACAINSDGEIAILVKIPKIGWEIDYSITEALSEGTRLKSNRLKTNNGIKDVNSFVSVGRDGLAVRFSTDKLVKKYYAVVYDLDKSSNSFEEYLTL
ncbi:MAG: hypothetical protein ACRC5T_11960 [Cetobacterium sp.]